MKIKQTILVFALVVGFVGIFFYQNAYAANCAGVDTSVIDCDTTTTTWTWSRLCKDGSEPEKVDNTKANSEGVCAVDGSTVSAIQKTELKNTGLWGLLLMAINILTGGIGIAAVGGIIYGSILYTSAGGSPDGVKKAKEIIVNVVIGLVAYAFMYSFLNFIIPGGLFS